MSERNTWRLGDPYKTSFSVTDLSENGVSGLTSFAIVLKCNGVVSNVPVTITEPGTPGDYEAHYTPDAQGDWDLYITEYDYNPEGWEDNILVQMAVLGVPYQASVAKKNSRLSRPR